MGRLLRGLLPSAPVTVELSALVAALNSSLDPQPPQGVDGNPAVPREIPGLEPQDGPSTED